MTGMSLSPLLKFSYMAATENNESFLHLQFDLLGQNQQKNSSCFKMCCSLSCMDLEILLQAMMMIFHDRYIYCLAGHMIK